MSSNRNDKENKKHPQHRTHVNHNWAIHQAKQQATQMGLTSAHMGLSHAQSKASDNVDIAILEALQKIWMRRGTFAPPNLANVFLQQTEHLTYADYKKSLVQYLWTAIANEKGLEPLKEKIQDTLAQLWVEQDHKIIDSSLRLRTCNRLISLLTTQGHPYPSSMFTLLAVQEQYDVFGLMMLRLMLLSRSSYKSFADVVEVLIAYYSELKNSKSTWIVNFLQAFKMNITEYLDRDFEHKIEFKPRSTTPDKP